METRHMCNANISSFDLAGKLNKAENEIKISTCYFTDYMVMKKGAKLETFVIIFNRLNEVCLRDAELII